VENGYRKMRCPNCGFEGDRDAIAKHLEEVQQQMGGARLPLDCPRGR